MSDHVLHFVLRQEEDCPGRSKFYRCPGNLFSGCCSVDPCNLPDCPDGTKDSGDDNETTTDTEERTDARSTTANERTDRTTLEPTRSELTLSSIEVPIVTSAPSQEDNVVSPSFTTEETLPVSSSVDTTIQNTQVTPDPSPTASVEATSTNSAGNDDDNRLPLEAIAGIIGGVVFLIICAAACFIYRRGGFKSKKFFRARDDDDNISAYNLQPYVMPSTNPAERQDVFNPFGDEHETPESRYTRACAYTDRTMKNHPVNHDAREQSGEANLPAPSVPERARTPRGRLDDAEGSQPSASNGDVQSGPSRASSSRDDADQIDWSRAYTSTPEIHGSPKQAHIARFQSTNLPRIVDLPSGTISIQRPAYMPYRPRTEPKGDDNGNSAGNGAGNGDGSLAPTGNRIRGDLNATAEDVSSNKYVNSWSRWSQDAAE